QTRQILILLLYFKSLVVRTAGLEPARFGRNQSNNPLKQNDNFRRNHPSHGDCGFTVRANPWGSQEGSIYEAQLSSGG
ncbi:hypothetical protein, partial [Acetobacter orleanensis]|uniref:hypothetical protein n=1 Tax=Acetobacter orleanensis TaxID=104099 RepID=UPI001ADFB30A